MLESHIGQLKGGAGWGEWVKTPPAKAVKKPMAYPGRACQMYLCPSCRSKRFTTFCSFDDQTTRGPIQEVWQELPSTWQRLHVNYELHEDSSKEESSQH